MMKRTFLILSTVIALIFYQAVLAQDTKTVERQIPVVKCSGPTYSIMVMDFDCKANACQGSGMGGPHIPYLYEVLSGTGGVRGFGKGLSIMLTNALRETNCFKIVDLEQYERMKKLLEATGQQVKPPKVDYMVVGAITALELERSGGALGGGFIPLLGAINVRKDIANLGVDINVMNPETLEIVISKSFDANSEKTSWGLFGGGGGKGGAVGGGWSISKNLSLDMVARDVVVQVTNSIGEKLVPTKIVERPTPPKREEYRTEETR